MMIAQVRRRLAPVSVLFSNTAWLFTAEFLAKLSRIATIVVLAMMLSPAAYGTAILALACHEMFALLLKAGAGAQIIRCSDAKLASYARNGATVQWAICLLLAVAQLSLAHVLAYWYDNAQITSLLQVMALTYLFYPWVSVKVFLLQRANKMRTFSIVHGVCVTAENLSIALFAYYQADIMAVAYGKIVFSVLWLVIFMFIPVTGYGIGANFSVIKTLLAMSGKLFSSELLKTLRLYLDVFIAAKVMTPELFGFYGFAKNAGVGLSQSIGNVFQGALYPFLCQLQRTQQLNARQRLIAWMTLGVSSIFVFQALLVPVYVPLLFDDKWQGMIDVVSVMCLLAIPTLFIDSHCCYLRAVGQFKHEIGVRLLCLLISAFVLAGVAPYQPMAFAYVMLFGGVLWCIGVMILNRMWISSKRAARENIL